MYMYDTSACLTSKKMDVLYTCITLSKCRKIVNFRKKIPCISKTLSMLPYLY